ncbi:hypothetical protein [Shewanella surugensis]|uniref:DUF3352 domain-containing protein n=1 Tax=Shewanella surugensis TaxID=212020 RepID=A0ABT0L9A6_9GAMM|nr:hypothetical protein [Shewanella surugensis]MCL1124291.1 hypothetical protein [Shewanella surugensis]
MKKILIAGAIVAAGAVGYWLSQETGSDNPFEQNTALTYIPSDTALFSGQLQPFPIKTYVNSLSDADKNATAELFEGLSGEDDPRAKFLFDLSQTYIASLEKGATFIQTWGLAEAIRGYFYTLGAIPVFKLDIADASVFWGQLDKAETSSGMTHSQAQLQDINYRVYALGDEENSLDMIVAINHNRLIVTFNTELNNDDILDTALELSSMPKSLADTGALEKIIEKYSFSHSSISFINHQSLITGITTTEGNRLAQQLTRYATQEGEDAFSELKQDNCRIELQGIGANWPQTVMGLKGFAVSEDSSMFDLTTVVESNNTVILKALSDMRGFIPHYVSHLDGAVAAMGLGLDVSKISGSLTDIWDNLLMPEYQCEPLAQFQQQLAQSDPAMVGMMTGMAQGVMGASAALLDYKLTEGNDGAELKSVDAIASISSDEPALLFNMMKMFAPALAEVSLPIDGTATDVTHVLALPGEWPIALKMAIKGKHLVIFNGDKGQVAAEHLSHEMVVKNDLAMLSFDSSKMLEPLQAYAEMAGTNDVLDLSQMKPQNMEVKLALDVDNKGIVLHSYVKSFKNNQN